MNQSLALNEDKIAANDNSAEKANGFLPADDCYESYDVWCQAKVDAARQAVKEGRVFSNAEVKKHSRELLDRLRPLKDF